MARKKQKNTMATAARIFLGAVLVLFGLNGFLQFMPMPQFPEAAMAFLGALTATGYMMPMIALLQIAVGAMLLLDKSTAFALLLLAPFSVNIVLFHLFLDVAGGIPAYVVAALNIYLLCENKDKYKSLCECK